jgi:hypothetical protein
MYKLDAVRDVGDEYSGPVINMEDVFTKDNGKIAFKFSSLILLIIITGLTFCMQLIFEL